MISELAFKVVKNACIIRIKKGEDGYKLIDDYCEPKFLPEQKQRLTEELINEGYLAKKG